MSPCGQFCFVCVFLFCFVFFSQAQETERALCGCLTLLLCHGYLCTEQPRGVKGVIGYIRE